MLHGRRNCKGGRQRMMNEKTCNHCIKSDVCGSIADFLNSVKLVGDIKKNNILMEVEISCNKFAPMDATVKREVLSNFPKCSYCAGRGFTEQAIDSTPECNQYERVKCVVCDGSGRKSI